MDDKTMVEARNRIRAKLCEYCLTNQWLMNELGRSGVMVDKSTLSDTLLGKGKSIVSRQFDKPYDESRIEYYPECHRYLGESQFDRRHSVLVRMVSDIKRVYLDRKRR